MPGRKVDLSPTCPALQALTAQPYALIVFIRSEPTWAKRDTYRRELFQVCLVRLSTGRLAVRLLMGKEEDGVSALKDWLKWALFLFSFFLAGTGTQDLVHNGQTLS